jgi:hypothetical protein
MDKEVVDAAIREGGLTPPDFDYQVEGDDPVFRSPLQLATGASAALVMLGSAVNEIALSRGGRSQALKVDANHAALSLLSMWLLKVDGELALARLGLGMGGMPAIFGPFGTSDGQTLHLQPGFAHHVDAILRALACEPTRDAVSARIAGMTGDAAETMLSDAGVPAVVIRDYATWLTTEQGRTMLDVPVVEIEQIADGPPAALAPAQRPLDDFRVLDLTRVLAGPTCSRILGELGADVLHVDSPNLLDLVPGQADTAHGKRMTFLDLEEPGDKATLRGLAERADVFVQSYRAGSLKRRGFGPHDLAATPGGIVYVSVNCYGHKGPWESRPGYDGNAMAATGITRVHEVEPSPGIAVAMNDYCTAYWGAYGALRGLLARAATGGSYHVKVSLTQSAMWFMRMGEPHARADGMDAADLTQLAEARYMGVEDSPYGKLLQLRPALNLPVTPPIWQRGTPLPGSSEARWLA